MAMRAYLLANTRDLHDRVDQAAGWFDLGRQPGQIGFLQFMYRGLKQVEDGLNRAGAGRVYDVWPL